jgi:hypothetical protein
MQIDDHGEAQRGYRRILASGHSTSEVLPIPLDGGSGWIRSTTASIKPEITQASS